MARKLGSSELPDLADALVEYFPGSLHAYSIVRNTAEGRLDRQVWVDAWPQFTALLIKPSEGAKTFMIDSHVVYKTPESDQTGCSSLLCDEAILDWSTTRHINGINDVMKDIICKEAVRHGCKATDVTDGLLMIATQSSLTETLIDLPSGMKDSSLRPEDAPFVLSKWPLTDIYKDARDYIKFLITNFPSVSLRHEADESILVGWGVVYSHGTMGQFYVEPEFRGQGLGKYLARKMSQIVLEKESMVFLGVNPTNIPVQELYTKCGFRLTDVTTICIRCEPDTE